MTILCVGSINIDNAYRVTRHPGPGETILDKGHLRGLGGKGANMALAAVRAGATVYHVGAIGSDGAWCKTDLEAAGMDVRGIATVEGPTGHAVIMVDDAGENIIVVHSGANHQLDRMQIKGAIARCHSSDWMLLQNETNLVPEAAEMAKAAGLRVAYAAAPFNPAATAKVLPHTDLLAVNQVEADQLEHHLGKPLSKLDLPGLLVTRGADGAVYRAAGKAYKTAAFSVQPVDTTGAGDTFLGYFLAGFDGGSAPDAALRRAAAAAAIQVTRAGAAEAIPSEEEVDAFLAAQAPV